jgi:RND family efflux transporter MFP subunit
MLNLIGNRLLLFFALAALFTVAACSRTKQQPEATANAATGAQAAATPEIVDVTTAAAITRNLQRTVEVVGSLAADEEVVVAAQVPGELSQLNVDFGSYVTQGQTIGLIDQRDAKLRVEQAEAALKQTLARLGMSTDLNAKEKFDPNQNADVRVAKASLDWSQMDLQRATKLVENGDVSRSIYDQAVTQNNLAKARHQAAIDAVNQQLAIVEQQRAALSLAKKAITDTVVRAPISGAVKEKFVNRGSYMAVGGRIISLVKINPLRLRADIPESSAAAVRKGQTMNLTVEALAGRTFTGRIVRIGPSLSEQTRALTVEAEVGNSGNQLRPGMFAKSQLITANAAPAVMVPAKAVLTVAGLSKVFVIENGKAVERIVKVGVADGELIEIVEGVNANEIVATSNQEKLQQGSAVTNR